MNVEDILTVDRIVCGREVTSKKKALETTAELLGSAEVTVPAHAIADGLFARERLGSTGLGDGVALPHTRSSDVARATGAFLRVHPPVDFDAPDDKPVDLLFGLMVPEESTDEHLQILARLAEIFSDPGLRNRLRKSGDPAEVLGILCTA